MMMKKSDFTYNLPQELIAQSPSEEREKSRLLLLDKKTGDVQHERFEDIVKHLNKGDCLVLNDTRVIPARLLGAKKGTGGKIEFVLLHQVEGDKWEVILRPGKKGKVGKIFEFGNGLLQAEILEIIEGGNRIVEFKYDGIFNEILDEVGIIPLPPYITKKPDDYERYQTVYSKIRGSSAAPTAGLHFTDDLIKKIKRKGVNIAYVTLHVGLGTFRPVKEENILNHLMHSEYYKLDKENADIINNANRVVAVGTTSCRVLETLGDENGRIMPGEGWTDIFIYPGYKFKVVKALITNFHLPESTLIMLVSAFSEREKVLNAYKIAVEDKYRFFSFGDAMFIE